MIGVPEHVHRAAHAHGCVARAGGKKVVRPVPQLLGNSCDGGSKDAEIQEFAGPDGVVLARKVRALGETLCWLRKDIAVEALAAVIDAEAAIERIKKALTAEMNHRDQVLADARGETLEHFREQRAYRGMKWDRARAQNRAGGL
jgi:hypothetical protein